MCIRDRNDIRFRFKIQAGHKISSRFVQVDQAVHFIVKHSDTVFLNCFNLIFHIIANIPVYLLTEDEQCAENQKNCTENRCNNCFFIFYIPLEHNIPVSYTHLAGIKEGVARMVKVDKRYEPNAENGNIYDELYRLYCKNYKALDEAGIFHQMK